MKKVLKVALILAFNFIYFVHAEGIPPEDFSTPRKTMNFFLKAMKSYKLGNKESLSLATKTFDQEGLNKNTKEYTLLLAAKKLIRTLDRLEYIDVNTIPENPSGSYWLYKQSHINLNGSDISVEISMVRTKLGKWLFSNKTLTTIGKFERSLEGSGPVKGVIALETLTDRLEEKLPKWIRNNFLGLKTIQWTFVILLLFLSLISDHFLRFFVTEKVTKIFERQKIFLDPIKKKKFTRPLGMIFGATVFLIGLKMIELPAEMFSIFRRIAVISLTISSVIASHNFVDIISLYLEKVAKESENKFDDILVPLLRKTAKTLVVMFGFIFIGDSLTIDMKGIVAGLGIGGIAFALAAKDTIANLFGSLTILLDRPFSIDDHVILDGQIEGTVIEVGLRSTKIKTFYDSIITVPNGQLTNIHIENYALRKFRRFNTTLGVQYDTPPEKIEAFCEGIRQIILNHKLTRKDYFNVYFSGMGASSLDIMLYLFWEVSDRPTELQERHRLLIDLLRLGQSMDIDFAFPTQTVHLYSEDKYSRKDIEGPPLDYGKQTAEKLVKTSITNEYERSSSQSMKI